MLGEAVVEVEVGVKEEEEMKEEEEAARGRVTSPMGNSPRSVAIIKLIFCDAVPFVW